MHRHIVSVLLIAAIGWGAMGLAWAVEPKPDHESTNEATADAGAETSQTDGLDRRGLRLWFPYSKLELEAEQKEQILRIHRKTLDRIKAIEEAEDEQVMALLTSEQRAEALRLREEKEAQRQAWLKRYLEKRRLERKREAAADEESDADSRNESAASQ